MQLSQLRDVIRLQTQATIPKLDSTTLDLYINQGLREIAANYMWPWLETSVPITLVATQRGYALPDDFSKHRSLVDDDHDTIIEYVSPAVFFSLHGNDTGNSGSEPIAWTIWEDEILLTPIPDAADVTRLTLYYIKTPTTLVADADEPPFIEGLHWILVEYVKWKVWEQFEYFSSADRAFQYYQLYLDELISYYKSLVFNMPTIYGDGQRRFIRPNILGLGYPTGL